MRADRLLSILLILQSSGRTTAQDLAERLEVSERTIYRDLDALSAAGVPVYAERGPGGGCILAEDYRTNLTGLNEGEVRALFMSGGAAALHDLGLGRTSDDAMLKLFAALPAAYRRDAERARQRLHLDAAGWNRPEEEVPFLRVLQEAVWQDRKLCLVHRRGDGDFVERIVSPYGLVAKASVWYLVAAVEGDIRTFRVSRIQSVLLIEEHFERPADFDLAAFWTAWCVQFKTNLPQYPVTIRIKQETLPWLHHVFGEGIHSKLKRAAPPDSEGRVTLTFNFETLEGARGRLLGLGTMVEVLEPLELRENIFNLAAELVAFYARPGPAELKV